MTTDAEKRIAQIEAQAKWLQSKHTPNKDRSSPSYCDYCEERWPCDPVDYADDMLWLIEQLRAAEEKI